MPRVFISYRRDDSIAYAGRIYDRLTAHFGVANVFMDIDTLEPGVDFVEALERTVGTCDVFLAVLGKQWLTAADEGGRPRLSHPEDFVALEIAAALDRRTIRVVPVLVGGARMPQSTELPEKLADFTRRQALILPDIGFHQTLGRLIQSIEGAEQERAARENAEAATRVEQERVARENAAAAALAERERAAREKAEASRRTEERHPPAVPVESAAPQPLHGRPPGSSSRRTAVGAVSVMIAVAVVLGLWLSVHNRPQPPVMTSPSPGTESNSGAAKVTPDTSPSAGRDTAPPPVKPAAAESKKAADPAGQVKGGIIYHYTTLGEYQSAVVRNPNDADLRADFAMALEQTGDLDAALKQYRISTTLPPREIGRAYLYRGYAEALEKKGDLNEAISAARKMLVSWPTKSQRNCSGYEEALIGRLLEKNGDASGAIAMWQETKDKEFQRTRNPGWAAKCDEQIERIKATVR